MRLFNLRICALLGVVLIAFTAPAFATGEPFSISGMVIDANGNPVQGANVTLVDFNFNILGIKNSGDDGSYDFVNVVSDTDTVTVKVNLTRDGKTYAMPQYFAKWYPAKGIQVVPSKETQIPGYPEPNYGYVYGAIQTSAGDSVNFISGIVYLVNLTDGVRYYEFADRTDGKGSYAFYVPPGSYVLYAQHWENGVCYESTHKQITVGRNVDMTDPGLSATAIILPLATPSNSPDPAYMPIHHDNAISGTVKTKNGSPAAGVTVTLLQEADNASGYIPMPGSDSRPVTTVTDMSGNYNFYGITPTADGGKSIQGEKSIKAMVGYKDSSGVGQTAYSEPEPLYYPDMILGYGKEAAARGISLPVVVPTDPGTVPKPTVTVSDAPTAVPASSVAVVPLLAALAIGLVCIIGLYVFFNRKGN